MSVILENLYKPKEKWDLLPYFLKNDNPSSLYYETDDHWNEKGQSIAATIISERLINEHLVIVNKDNKYLIK